MSNLKQNYTVVFSNPQSLFDFMQYVTNQGHTVTLALDTGSTIAATIMSSADQNCDPVTYPESGIMKNLTVRRQRTQEIHEDLRSFLKRGDQ